MVNANGDTEEWLDVAQSDGGRIVAVRNKPGRLSNFSWFKIWEPDGSSTCRGTAQRTERLDRVRLSARLRHHRGRVAPRLRVLELEQLLPDSGSVMGRTCGRRPTARSIRSTRAARRSPSLFGARVISIEHASSPTLVNVQNADGGNPYTNAFTPWLDTSGVGLDLEGVDVAANGRLAALGFEDVERRHADGRQDRGPRDPGGGPGAHVPGRRGLLPARGRHRTGRIARAGRRGDRMEGRRRREGRRQPLDRGRSLRDGKRGGGALPDRRAPVDRTGRRDRVPAQRRTPTPAVPGPGAPGATAHLAPVVKLPKKLTAKALAASRGVAIKVKVSSPGKVTITGTVPARRLGRRGKPVVVATGTGVARAAGTVTIRLRLTTVGRRRVRRLKGARLTLRVVQGSRSTTKVVRLR